MKIPFSLETILPAKAYQFYDLLKFGLGFVGLYQLFKIDFSTDLEIDKKNIHPLSQLWQARAFKIADVCGNLSLILNGLRTTPAKIICQVSVSQILTHQQSIKYFGKAGLLPTEKIEKTMEILAFILSIPSTLKTLYAIYSWSVSSSKKKPTQISFRRQDLYITAKTMSETAHKILIHSPHK